MNIKETLYQETKGSSLFDYCLFNKSNKDIRKNEFLSLVINSLKKEAWFEISNFSNLAMRPIDKGVTQVPFANDEVKNEEIDVLLNIFTKEEILLLSKIIKDMKSYGVLAIIELMDEHDEAAKKKGMRSAFFNIFSSRTK